MLASHYGVCVDETLAVLGDYELFTDTSDVSDDMLPPVVVDTPDIAFDIVDFMSFVDLDSSAFTAALKAPPARSRRKRAARCPAPQTPKPPRKFRRTEILALRHEVETLTTQLRQLQRARSHSQNRSGQQPGDESGDPDTRARTLVADNETRHKRLSELRASEATNKRLKRQIAKQLEQHTKLVNFLHELTTDQVRARASWIPHCVVTRQRCALVLTCVLSLATVCTYRTSRATERELCNPVVQIFGDTRTTCANESSRCRRPGQRSFAAC